jgi:dihydropyrimidine dehydrogenase (NAD+) subunit PreA
VTNWRDAVEFILLGSSSVQVCTEVMLRGYRIVEDMIEGLDTWMGDKGFATLDDVVGKSIPGYSEWGNLNLNFETVAKINADSCIGCNRCMVACHDGAHQCIHPSPVPDCISMVEVANGFAPASWNEHLAEGATLRPKKGAH